MLRKKIMSVVLSAVMIVSLLPMAQVSAAYSANSGTITIGVTSQTFSLYKIFNASTADGGVNFTYSLNTTDFSGFSSSVAAYNSDPVDYVENASDAELQALTKELYTYVTTGAGNSIVPTKIDNTTNKSGALEDGYYFVLETTSLSDIDALSAGILVSVLGEDINVALKTALPTIEKKIQENSDSKWYDVADHQIGETVNFQITATLPTAITGYDDYVFTITDEMDSALELVGTPV